MKIINFRYELCISIAILSCLVLTVLWSGMLDQQLEPLTTPPKRALISVKTTSMVTNYSRANRSMNRPKYSMPLSKHQEEADWQSILKGSPLMLGLSYSNGRTGVEYVLGVPTVHGRGQKYLMQTLAKLINELSDIQRRQCLIVICIGETEVEIVEDIWKGLSETFGQHLDDGLIDIISPPVNYYPDFESLYITLNDDVDRVRWRTKQTLDYMFLMTYARSRGKYYLQLEDDITPAAGYFDYVTKLVGLHSQFRLAHQRQWIVLSFSELGFIGKLFRTEEIKPFLSYAKIFYNDQPIDWLLQSYVKLRCCRWDSFHMPDCHRDYNKLFVRALQSQFQHIGVKSSLPVKEQKLKDSRYKINAGRLRMNHLRQPFNLISSHKKTLLLDKRNFKHEETFIWGYMPQMTSFIKYLKYHQYAESTEIKIRSGRQNTDSFTELTVNLVNKEKSFQLNESEMESCGFIMSYTHRIGIKTPFIIFFYIKENQLDSNETQWFRRFNGNDKAATLVINLSVQICFLLWSLW